MPKKQSTKKRVNVKGLPAAKTKLTEKQMKRVKGGVATHESLITGATIETPAEIKAGGGIK